MATREFSTLIPRISPSVPGCPRPTMIQAIRDAAIFVCEKTLLWRYTQPKYNLLPGVHEYAFDKPAAADVHVVFDAIMNDMPLQRLTLEQALEAYPAWADLYSGEDPSVIWSLTPSSLFGSDEYNDALFNQGSAFELPPSVVADGSEPRAICQLTPEQYIVLPLPDNAKVYTMRMFYALKPRRDASGMEDAVLSDLEDAIVHYALQYLLVMPNIAWGDRDLAQYHGKQALFKTTERRARANLSNMRGTMTARAPRFA